MRPQLPCGKLSVTCITVPSQQHRSHGPPAVPSPRNFRLCRQSKKMRVMAAVHRNEAMEMAPPGLRLREGDQVFVSSVGVPAQESLASFRDWYMADKQLVVISFSAVVTAGFMTMLLGAAIPSLIAMKKAAEALEKLADTAREELPGTMAAIRLSGMEISDLTMELNDIGQEISKGVRSSARTLNASESVMRQVGVIASDVWQKKAVVPVAAMQPLVARTAKQVSERFVQTRTLVVNLQIISRVSSWIPVLAIPFQSKKGQSSSSTSG